MSSPFTPACFAGFPRVMVRYGDDPQEIELFRSKPGQSLNQFELRMMTRDLGSDTIKAHVRIAHATSLKHLDSPRPRILYLKNGGGGYGHAAPKPLQRAHPDTQLDQEADQPAP